MSVDDYKNLLMEEVASDKEEEVEMKTGHKYGELNPLEITEYPDGDAVIKTETDSDSKTNMDNNETDEDGTTGKNETNKTARQEAMEAELKLKELEELEKETDQFSAGVSLL